MKNIDIKTPSDYLIKLFSFKEWRQRIHLYDDVYTPGTRCNYEWDMCFMPSSLDNLVFMDVGSNDGMFSFLAEENGAKEVIAVDLYNEQEESVLNMTNGWFIGRIEAIKKLKKSKIKIESCSIYNLSTLEQKADIVYCGNVIAWLNNPIEAIAQLAKVTKKTLIIREDLSLVNTKPLLEYVNNQKLDFCMFNGNKLFYIEYLTALGFTNIRFKQVDEYEIFLKRNSDFPRFSILPEAKVYSNPFDSNYINVEIKQTIFQASSLVNNRYFINLIGWISADDLRIVSYNMIPQNFIKKKIFEYRYKRNMVHNYIIMADKIQ